MNGHPATGGSGADEAALAAIVRGMAVALVGSLIGGGFGFLFSVVMARTLEPHDFGLLVLALGLLAPAATLAIGGADLAAVRFVSAATSPGEKRGALATPFLLALVLNTAVAALTLGLARPISENLLGEPDFVPVLRALALVLPLTTAAQMLSAGLSGLELASGELARKVVEQGGRIVLGVTLASLGFGLVGVVLGLAAAAAAAAIVVGYLLARALPRGGETVRVPLRPVLGFSWPQTVAKASGELWTLLVLVALGRTTGSSAVAIFGAALALARLPSLVYNAFAFRFSPAISRLWEAGDRAQLQELLRSVTRLIALAAIPLFAVPIALPGPLLGLYGGHYRDGALALALISAAGLINSVVGPVERALIMTGRVRLELWGNLLAAGVTALAVFPVVDRHGLVGAAATVVGFTVLMNSAKLLFVFRALGLTTMSRSLWRPFAAGAVASVAAWGIEAATGLGDSLPGTAVLSLGLIAVYVALVLGVFRLDAGDREALALARGRRRADDSGAPER